MKTHKGRTFLRAGALLAVVVTGGNLAQACSVEWTGNAGNGAWSTAGNWSTHKVPGLTSEVCIPTLTTADATATPSISHRAVRVDAPRQFERHTVRRPQRDRQPQASPAVGRDLHRPGVRLDQRIVYEPHSGVHADNQRKQHHSEKAISGPGRNGVLLRNIELTLFRAQEQVQPFQKPDS
jgi:hypothetical protein